MSGFDNAPLTRRERAAYIAGLMFSAAVIIGWLTLIGIGMAFALAHFWRLIAP